MGGLGEWGLLAALLPRLNRGLGKTIPVGPGDDAALFRAGGGTWAITTDMLVEGVHFRRRWTGGADLGHKTLAVNLSDLAAMGDVEPVLGVLSAGLPPGTPVSFVEDFYRGFAALARRSGFKLVGGDTVRAARMTFSLTALGRVRGPVFRRSTARPGDLLLATGTLGDAAAGLRILEKRGRPATADERFLVERFRRPTPRRAWARSLARSGRITAGLDVSDGLWRSVKILTAASGVGARVDAERLPLSGALRRWAGPRAASLALTGGEDYELLLTAAPASAARWMKSGTVRVIGRIEPARHGARVYENGIPREVPPAYEHFNG